jgi:glycosyltransferase involved in cell wall biosynthesis
VVFSGGKLEFRKGQDIVLGAFREFVRRHPEALLVTCWHNPWPDTVAGIESRGHVTGRPSARGGRLDLQSWVHSNGIPSDAFVDLGPLAHEALPDVLRDAHVGVFPNRAEGGTNLVLMEAMACGMCVIASANTGHLDVVDPATALLLSSQERIVSPDPRFGTAGWGESSVDEVVAHLERAWDDADLRQRLGSAAAARMKTLTWATTAASIRSLVLQTAVEPH